MSDKQLIVNWVGWLTLAAMVLVLVLGMTLTDPERRADRVRDEAVKRGFADWEERADGGYNFEWRAVPTSEPTP